MANNKKQKKEQENKDIKINNAGSSLAEFTCRELPTEEEVENFEEYVREEVREEDIEEGLEEIYQDDDGKLVDVRKLEIKKKRGFLYYFFLLIFLGIIGGGAYLAYNYSINKVGLSGKEVEFKVGGKSEVVAGEEFFYTLDYVNNSNVVVNKALIEVKYPGIFVFIDAFPGPSAKNSAWEIGRIGPNESGRLMIKGMMIGAEGETGAISATLTYMPENFSSEFRKEAPFTTIINDLGLDIEFDYFKTALVNEKNELKIRFRGRENNYLKNFRVTLDKPENLEITTLAPEESGVKDAANYANIRPGVWDISEIVSEDRYLPIVFTFNEKTEDKQTLVFKFTQLTGETEDDKYLEFREEQIEFEVMKSDLNLTLIINGSRQDQGVDFGETLNYSIVYNNKGETELHNVIIMAVLKSDFLDRTTLNDGMKGREKGNTITWSKEEIETLAVLGQDEEGTIDFSISMMDIGAIEPDKAYEVESYAQYSVGRPDDDPGGDEPDPEEDSDNRSNIIINRINSDMTLDEAVRYFSVDNIPVGTGPHPPQVGEKTEYKVYWEVVNNLHELNELKVTAILPDYVQFSAKNRATVGTVEYDSATREVIWDVGRLPVTVYQASGEFNISVTPDEEDKNKIMILLTGTKVSAKDNETETIIEKTVKAKTTKLSGDDIASGDGIVE